MISAQPIDLKTQSLRAFRRDLPQLWIERPGQFVAYQGEQQLGFDCHKHRLYQQCYERGLLQDEFVIFCIEPEETEMTLGPVMI